MKKYHVDHEQMDNKGANERENALSAVEISEIRKGALLVGENGD